MKKHWYCVTAKIMFVTEELKKQGEPCVMECNTIAASDIFGVPLKLIGQANQKMAMSMIEELNDPTFEVVRSTILGVSYLGEMTAEEFYAGTELAQKPETVN